MVALMLIGFVLLALTADYLVLSYPGWRVRQAAAAEPAGFRGGPGHMWVVAEAGGAVRVGADDLVGLFLGRPERIAWQCTGSVKRGDPIAVLHARNRELTVRSPVDGVLLEQNTSLDPAEIAKQPFGAGWLVRIRAVGQHAVLGGMLSGEGLRRWSRNELDRLRTFLLAEAREGAVGVTAPDGGPLGPELLSVLDERTWKLAAEQMFAMDASTSPGPKGSEP